MRNNFVIIMAGGIGSRFWPMSTEEKPKQFLDVLGIGKTLLQQTVDRFSQICTSENILIVTSEKYKEIVLEQCPKLKEEQILLEPCMRNTAPCIAYACYKIKSKVKNANIIVAPSDHLITKENEFTTIIKEGINYIENNDTLLTLGINPHKPETGYGYIQSGEVSNNTNIFKVKAFKEKPDLETAKKYLESGDFFWNSGIFLWSLQSIIKAFELYLPELVSIFEKGNDFYFTNKEQDFINSNFPKCTNISIDYGVMEKADNIFVYPSDFGWSDLGTWGSLYEKRNKNFDTNSVVGNNVKLFESESCIVNVPDNRNIVIQGLKDFIVVEANDVILICKKQEEQRIKEFRKSIVE